MLLASKNIFKYPSFQSVYNLEGEGGGASGVGGGELQTVPVSCKNIQIQGIVANILEKEYLFF